MPLASSSTATTAAVATTATRFRFLPGSLNHSRVRTNTGFRQGGGTGPGDVPCPESPGGLIGGVGGAGPDGCETSDGIRTVATRHQWRLGGCVSAVTPPRNELAASVNSF